MWSPFGTNDIPTTALSLADAEIVFPTAQARFPPRDDFAMADVGQTTTEPAGLSFVPHNMSALSHNNNNNNSNTIALPDLLQFDFSGDNMAPGPMGHKGENDADCHEIFNGPTATRPPNNTMAASEGSKRRRLETEPDDGRNYREVCDQGGQDGMYEPSPCNSAMRRTVGNGLSFQGITKLRGAENYEEWVRAVRAAARKEGVWDMMTGACERPCSPPRPGASTAALQDYNDDLTYWENKRDLALGGIEGSLAESVQPMADGIKCALALWRKLEQVFKPSEQKSLYSTMQKLESLSLEQRAPLRGSPTNCVSCKRPWPRSSRSKSCPAGTSTSAFFCLWDYGIIVSYRPS